MSRNEWKTVRFNAKVLLWTPEKQLSGAQFVFNRVELGLKMCATMLLHYDTAAVAPLCPPDFLWAFTTFFYHPLAIAVRHGRGGAGGWCAYHMKR